MENMEKDTEKTLKVEEPKKITKRRTRKPKVTEPELTEEQKNLKAAADAKVRIKELELKAREEDMRPVTGVFKNFQSPNLITKFSKRKYPGEPITTYKFRDGETVTVPFYVAKDLRQGCYYKRNVRYTGSDGGEELRMGEFVKVMDFYPHTEFIPGIELEKGIIQVQKVR